MSRIKDALLRVRNILKITNVYECARPTLLMLAILGAGATWIRRMEGVYSLHNTRLSLVMTVLMAVIFVPITIIQTIIDLFEDHSLTLLNENVNLIIEYLWQVLSMLTVDLGYLMAYVSCKHLDRILQIIYNIDRQLEEVNIRVKHGQVTLKVTLIALVTTAYSKILYYITLFPSIGAWFALFVELPSHLFFVWIILFLLVIHERFVALNKLLQQNATIPNIEIIGDRNRRNNYVRRRISLARHVHEQLTEVVRLFSDTCRYMLIGLLTNLMLQTISEWFWVLVYQELWEALGTYIPTTKFVVLILICQANKNQRRVLTSRLRHLLAFELDGEIIQQLQQYIMYNAYSTTGLIDFQFTDIDNVLLLTILDVVVSNVLIIYSYTRQWK